MNKNYSPALGRVFFQTLSQIDWPLFFIVLALSIVGIVFSYSSQILIFEGKVNPYDNYIRQTFYLLSGMTIMFVMSFINYRKLAQHSFLLYVACILLLLYTLVGGTVVNQSKRWISLGFFSFQPSEFVKIAIIIFAAHFLEKNKNHHDYFWKLLLLTFYLSIPIALIMLQPDLGTAAVFVPIFSVMLIMVGIKPKYFFLFFTCIALAVIALFVLTYSQYYEKDTVLMKIISNEYYIFVTLFLIFGFAVLVFLINIQLKNIFLWDVFIFSLGIFSSFIFSLVLHNFVLKGYQKERLLAFIDPYRHKWDLGYNVIQSQTAIGSGGFLGRGLFNGVQGQLGFLPARTTDFIFSVVGEELGFVGAVLLLVLFFLFLFRLYQMAMRVKDDLGNLIIVGVFTMFCIQIVINISMTVGLAPVTGIPLPFLSSGGSTLWASLMAIGLVFSVNARRFVNQ